MTITAPESELVAFNSHIPQNARCHDYLLGGKDYFLADRVAAVVARLP